MTLDLANTDKLATFAGEARRAGIEVLPPCVNGSFVDFLAVAPSSLVASDTASRSRPDATVPGGRLPAGESPGTTKRGAIRYSLAALKNIGPAAVQTIIDEREKQREVRRPRRLRAPAEPQGAEQARARNAVGCRCLRRLRAEPLPRLLQRRADPRARRPPRRRCRDRHDRHVRRRQFERQRRDARPAARESLDADGALDEEFKAIGFYLSGHPLDAYESTLKTLNITSYAEFVSAVVDRGASGGRLAGIVVAARERRSAKGNKFAFAMFSDQTGSFEAVIFSDTLDACGHLLEAGTAVVIGVEAERDGDTVKLRVGGLEALDAAAANAMRGMKVVLDGEAILAAPTQLADVRTHLKSAAANAGRGAEISFVLRLADGREIDLAMPRARFTMTPNQIGELIDDAGRHRRRRGLR